MKRFKYADKHDLREQASEKAVIGQGILLLNIEQFAQAYHV